MATGYFCGICEIVFNFGGFGGCIVNMETGGGDDVFGMFATDGTLLVCAAVSGGKW
jgi:hypothetical protein